MNETGQIEIYQAEDGQTEIQVRLEKDTLWLSQAQMADLFDKDSDTIGLHLKNIYKSGELDRLTTTYKSSVVRIEGTRKVRRQIQFYNLDAIISVGYRVNSIKGTRFLNWATQRFQQNANELQQALNLIRKAAQASDLASDMGRGLVDIMGRYTQTFLWIQQYDEGLLKDPKGYTGGNLPSPMDAMAALGELKRQLIARGEATNLAFFEDLIGSSSIRVLVGSSHI